MDFDDDSKKVGIKKNDEDVINDDDFEAEQEELAGKKNKKGFRLCSASFFLTYPQFDIAPEEFFKKFKDKMLGEYGKEIKMAIVSREDHKDTQGKHIHVYGKFAVKVDTRNSRYFDLDGHHPHIEPVKNQIKCIKYVAGYTVKKFQDQKDLHCYNLDLGLYLYNKKNHKATKLEELCNKKIDFVDWVNNDFSNVMRLQNSVKNVQMYWNLKSVNTFAGRRACFWIYGQPGIGKSYSIINKFTPAELYRKNASDKWWDSYCDQRAVLIDDFDNKYFYHYLKIWSDQYVFRGEIKGGFVNCTYSLLFITSNYTIDYLFSKKKYDKDEGEVIDEDDHFSQQLVKALKRRFYIICADDYVVKEDKFSSSLYFDFDLALSGFEEQLKWGIPEEEGPKTLEELKDDVKKYEIEKFLKKVEKKNNLEKVEIKNISEKVKEKPREIEIENNNFNVMEEKPKVENIDDDFKEEIDINEIKKNIADIKKYKKMIDDDVVVVKDDDIKEKNKDEPIPGDKEINLDDNKLNDENFDPDKIYEKEIKDADDLKKFIVSDEEEEESFHIDRKVEEKPEEKPENIKEVKEKPEEKPENIKEIKEKSEEKPEGKYDEFKCIGRKRIPGPPPKLISLVPEKKNFIVPNPDGKISDQISLDYYKNMIITNYEDLDEIVGKDNKVEIEEINSDDEKEMWVKFPTKK